MKKIVLLAMGLVCALATTKAASLVDSTFNPGTGAGGGIVEQALPLPDGRILICGNFTSFNGRNRAYVARLNADGSVDESFLAQPGYWVRNMALQTDGKIVIGGYFTTVQGVPRNLVARLLPDGALDPSFDPGTGARDIIAGGIDGNIDPFVFWVAVQPDQKIIITGNFRNYNGASSTGIVRINPDGSRDTSFNTGSGLDSWGRHLEVLPNGQILVAGWFTAYKGQAFNRLVRINPDGSADSGFHPFFGDRTAIYSTVQQPDGKIIATGHSLNYEGLFTREMERLNPDGSVDASFVGFTNEKTESTVLQPDGKLIVAGNFTQANNTPRTALARFNSDGTLDTSFSANIDNFIWGTALQSDGKLLIAGGFYNVDGVARSGVARLNTEITGGTTTGGGTGGTVQDIAPSLLVGSPTANSLTLGWSDHSTIRTGYTLEQRNSAGTFEGIANFTVGTRSYVVNGLVPATSYTFRLRASNSQGGTVYSNEGTRSTAAVSGGGANSAKFIGADSATAGNWTQSYGADGYTIFGDQARLPAWAGLTAIGKSDWTWQWSTADGRALQRPGSQDRIAGCWYSASSYTMDLNLTDGGAHRVAVYFLDWDGMGRSETIQVTDAGSGAILDGRSISTFNAGVYLIWELTGHVKLTVTANSGNAVASGLFFGVAGSTGGGTSPVTATPTISPNGGTFTGPVQVTLSTTTGGGQIRYTLNGSEPSESSALYSGTITISSSATLKAKTFAPGYTPGATAAATFTITAPGGGSGENKFSFAGADLSTKGNWLGTYGSQGFFIEGKGAVQPSWLQISTAGRQEWIWNDSTTDTRALLTPDGSSRIASCWYGDRFTVDLKFTDTATHRVSVYLMDWDQSGRAQTVELIDGDSGAVVQTENISGFSGGQYLTWDMKGHLMLRFTKVAGFNAVLNGLFFEPSPASL